MTSSVPRILLTNDDGVNAIGLEELSLAAAKVGHVSVVAPDLDQSGSSHSLTLGRPILVNRLRDDVISVDGTPTDCVLLAVRALLDHKPDILISGINHGSNMGEDVMYSGTVAAAVEGALLGIPSMALSLTCRHGSTGLGASDFTVAVMFSLSLARLCLERGLPARTVLNVNVPYLPPEEVTGVEVTSLGTREYQGEITRRRDSRGNSFYWIGGDEPVWEEQPGTDVTAVRRGRISVTPVGVDRTDRDARDRIEAWPLEGLVFKDLNLR